MPFGVYYAALQDAQGNSLAGQTATVTVRVSNEGGMLASQLYQDRAGALPLDNPFTTELGQALFFAPGGSYYIHVQAGALEFELPYQQVGLGAETDITGLVPRGDWAADQVSYNVGHMVTSAQGRLFASLIDANVGNAPPDADLSDAEWQWLPAIAGPPGSSDVAGSSSTSETIASGAKSFAVAEAQRRGWGAGARLRFASAANPSRDWMEGPVTVYAHPDVTVEIDLTGPNAQAGPHADWTINLAGYQGPQGADGTDPGYLFDFETETGAPPSAGGIRANNADLSAATELYVSGTTRGGSDVTALIQALAPGGKSVNNSILLTAAGSEGQAGFTVTGVTDETGYTTLSVAGHAGKTAFAAGAISLQREISGQDGSDGTMTGPAGGVSDNEVAVYNGPSGASLKESGILAGSLLRTGLHQIGYWPARALIPQLTDGMAPLAVKETTLKIPIEYLATTPGQSSYCVLSFRAPKSLDEGATLTLELEYSEGAGATAHGTHWIAHAQAQGNGDALDSAWGVNKSAIVTGAADVRNRATISDIVPAGTWAEGDEVLVRIRHNGESVSDTLDVPAHLHGVSLFATVSGTNDA